MRLINIKCSNNDSFKYSLLLYLYYYNMKTSHNRVTEIDKHTDPYIFIHFNDSNDINQFEKDNPFIDLFIIDFNNKPLFLTRNNANIKITIGKLNDYRYSLCKPFLQCFKDNIAEIKRINNNHQIYKLTDKIKKDLRLDLKYII